MSRLSHRTGVSTNLVIFRCLVQACSVFILHFLILAILGILHAEPVPFREAVESLHTAAPIQPFTLACGSALLGLSNQGLCLRDGVVEPAEEGLIVAPGVKAYAVLGGSAKALVIFVAIFLEQNNPRARFLFACQQLTEPPRGFVHAQL